MRASQLFCPTLREAPAEAERASHRLLVRAGYIRPVGAGLYAYLPLGWRTLRKMERLVREEMEAIGCQEVRLPLLQPAELWQASGRWEASTERLFTLADRKQARFVLGPTFEEVCTQLVARELRSYRQLPLRLYQFQARFRDELRPRDGLLRLREAWGLDLYSFDADPPGLEASFQGIWQACRRILERCGLPWMSAEAAPPWPAGSRQLMVPTASGGEALLHCPACGYTAPREDAEFRPTSSPSPAEGGLLPPPLEKAFTPGATTVAELTRQLQIGPERLVIKTLLYVADGEVVAALVRGDRELDERRLRAAWAAVRNRPCQVLEMADGPTVERVTGAPVGFAGPVGLKVPLLADLEVAAMADFVVGANEADTHFLHTHIGRDFELTWVGPLRFAAAGDGCPRCQGRLEAVLGFEVGHLSPLGTRYSEVLGATFSDESGQRQPVWMGSYGLELSRLLAVVAERHHDGKGLCWPRSLAPFEVHLLLLNESNQAQRQAAEQLYRDLRQRGWEVLLDDRAERPGTKFHDADLIGLPVQVVVGRKLEQAGVLEVRARGAGTAREVPLSEGAQAVEELLREANAT